MALETKKNYVKQRRIGWYCLGSWAVLIIAGIVAKRGFGHPDWMVFFHLPAAVFLVTAFGHLSAEFRDRYREELLSKRRIPLRR